MGAGNDTIRITTGTTGTSLATFISSTIFGGAGSDLLFDSQMEQMVDIECNLRFKTADPQLLVTTPSLLVVDQGRNVQVHVSLAQTQLATADFTASNSVVTFTSTFSQDLTAC